MLRLFRRIPLALSKIASFVSSALYDPYWSSVAFLQHGGLSNSALSVEGVGAGIANSNPAVRAFSPLSGQAGFFNGSGSYLSVPGDASLVEFGTGDFTIEAWVYLPVSPGTSRAIIASGESSGLGRWAFEVAQSNGSFGFSYSAPGSTTSSVQLLTTATIPVGKWTHCAVERSNKNFYLYMDGKPLSVTGVSGTNNTDTVGLASNKLYIAHDSWANADVQCAVDSIKITKGVSRYTETFVPPKGLPSGANDPYWNNVTFFMDFETGMVDSALNHAITIVGNSMVYDSSSINSNVLYFPNYGYTVTQGLGAVGTGDFTFETRICQTDVVTTNGKAVFDCRPTNSNGTYITLVTTGAMQLALYVNGEFVASGTTKLLLNKWYHIALVRRGGITTAYIDGVVEFTYTDSNNYLLGAPKVGIHAYPGSLPAHFVGFMSETRFSVGVARYSGPFTPPTQSLPDSRYRDYYWDSTVLLMHLYNGTDVVGNGNTNALNGKASFSSSRVLFGSTSLLLPGNSDFIVNNTGAISLGAALWTAECFINASVWSTNNSVIMSQDNANGSDGWQLFVGPNGSGLSVSLPGGTVFNAAYSFALDTWYHLAVSWDGGHFYLAINGIVVASSVVTGRSLTTAYPLRLGSSSNTNARNFFTGAISEVRLTKGVARYTANFTPPSFALPEKPNGDLHWQYVNGLFDFNESKNLITGNPYVLSGSAKVSTTTKTGTNSLYVPLNAAGNAYSATDGLLQFGTGDFTVEFWARLDSNYDSDYLYLLTNGLGPNNVFYVRFGDGGFSHILQLVLGSNVMGNVLNSNYNKNSFVNTWHHVAIQRRNGTVTFYVDGVAQGSKVLSGTVTAPTTWIGGWCTGNKALCGNIADLRATKTARYNGNFKPPALPPPQVPAS